jgi:hypothetical protein
LQLLAYGKHDIGVRAVRSPWKEISVKLSKLILALALLAAVAGGVAVGNHLLAGNAALADCQSC